ncbi:MAG: LPS export ABC transporter periplasmic protein LptC [Neisseriaceae bacterium]|nr:LPS export ABC transporter periplasmic protein LptC [Neisseriaceae bacterium PsAf]MCV2503616.1 LPS export ABC transporter periplasmic protein LptC [Neisseriaceae bacterium]MCV2509452.1 LPS export ABC transporter periplasmic protein LptC [Neisseriaceae bacterium]
MKSWLNSIIFPTLLIILLAIFTLWFNKITLLDEQFSRLKNEPITTMYDANIQSFNVNGELENDVHASKITQVKNSNSFMLNDSEITRYRSGKMIQNVTAKQAIFNDDTKKIKLTSGPKDDQNDGRVEIIINEI